MSHLARPLRSLLMPKASWHCYSNTAAKPRSTKDALACIHWLGGKNHNASACS